MKDTDRKDVKKQEKDEELLKLLKNLLNEVENISKKKEDEAKHGCSFYWSQTASQNYAL